jgi:hypothetical protein
MGDELCALGCGEGHVRHRGADAPCHVDLAGLAVIERAGDVAEDACDHVLLGAEHLGDRLAASRVGEPVDAAHVVARSVGAVLLELGGAAAALGQVLARRARARADLETAPEHFELAEQLGIEQRRLSHGATGVGREPRRMRGHRR